MIQQNILLQISDENVNIEHSIFIEYTSASYELLKILNFFDIFIVCW